MSLKWFVGSNGNLFADTESIRYCVAREYDRSISVAANGNEISSGLNDSESAKRVAEEHANMVK